MHFTAEYIHDTARLFREEAAEQWCRLIPDVVRPMTWLEVDSRMETAGHAVEANRPMFSVARVSTITPTKTQVSIACSCLWNAIAKDLTEYLVSRVCGNASPLGVLRELRLPVSGARPVILAGASWRDMMQMSDVQVVRATASAMASNGALFVWGERVFYATPRQPDVSVRRNPDGDGLVVQYLVNYGRACAAGAVRSFRQT